MTVVPFWTRAEADPVGVRPPPPPPPPPRPATADNHYQTFLEVRLEATRELLKYAQRDRDSWKILAEKANARADVNLERALAAEGENRELKAIRGELLGTIDALERGQGRA